MVSAGELNKAKSLTTEQVCERRSETGMKLPFMDSAKIVPQLR